MQCRECEALTKPLNPHAKPQLSLRMRAHYPALLLIAGAALCVFAYTASEGGSAPLEPPSKWSTSRQQSNADPPAK
jgi:hypothetical protein